MRQPPQLEPYAILVADMIGYSQRLAQHPVATHTAFTAHLRDVFEPTVGDHDGRIIKTTGDGFVAIFKDAGQAESCARRIQLDVELQDNRELSSVALTYRVAVHYGEIVVEEHDIFGLDVNVAIHMQRLAPPGGVCLSNALFVRLPEQSKRRYRFLGQRYLKNIPDPIAIHTHDPSPSSSDRPPSHGQLPIARRRYLSPPPRLGLVQFRTLADTASRRVLAGIAYDSLTRGLSRFGDVLTVAPIGAEVRHIASEKSRALLSNELACEYLLLGSCIIGPRTLELVAHLESLVKRELVWSGKLKVDLEQQLDLIDELVAAEMVAPIVLHLERAEAAPWGAGRHSEDEVLFREAKRLIARRTLASLDQARQLLSGIVGRCGEVGDVYIALARAEHSHGLLLAGEPFVEAIERAWGYAKNAVEVDDLNPNAHAELALQEMFLKRQSGAAEIYQRALKMNPYDPMIRADWADCLVNMGRAQEAAPILEEVLSGWPRDRPWVEWNLCDAYWALDRPDRIVTLLERHPDQPHVHRYLAASYARLGRLAEARQHADRVRFHQPGFSTKQWSRVVPFATTDSSEEYVDFLKRAGL